METKICSKCREEKPLEEFTKKRIDGTKREPRCRDCRNARHLERYAEERLRCLQIYSGNTVPFCACCGESHLEFLTIDHINGGGGKERRSVKGANVFCYWIKAQGYPAGYRVLCMNCNLSYGMNGYCPHQKK